MSGENSSDNIQEKNWRVIIEYVIDTLLAKRDENESERQETTRSYETALQKVKKNETPLYETEAEQIAIARERNRRRKIYRGVVLTDEEIQKIISYFKEGIREKDLKSFNDEDVYSSVDIIKEALRRLMVKMLIDNEIDLDIFEEIIPSTKEGDKGKRNLVLDQISTIKDLFEFFDIVEYYPEDKSRRYEFILKDDGTTVVVDGQIPKGQLCCTITREGTVQYTRKPKWLELGNIDVSKMLKGVCRHDVGGFGIHYEAGEISW